MTNTARNDVHRPVEMDPANYQFLTAIDNSPEMGPGWVLLLGDWGLELSRKISASPLGHERGVYQCHHCGARIRYAALLEHLPTGDVIVVGETCLDNRFELESKAQFDRLRKSAALDRQKQAIKTAARAYVADLLETADPIGNRLGLAMSRDEETKTFTDLSEMLKPGWAIDTFSDIRRKVWDVYGAPTTRQQDLLIRLLEEGAAWHAEQAELAANPPVETPKVDAPVGRTTFEGKVVFRKGYESDFGFTMKIIVVVTTDAGEYSVFVTEPKAIETEKGDIVQITATLAPGRSAHEARGSRPSKASIVQAAADAELPSALA